MQHHKLFKISFLKQLAVLFHILIASQYESNCDVYIN